MLFNSYSFLFLFLPLTVIGYYGLIAMGLRRRVLAYLVVASLVFYSVWNPAYTLLLIASMLGNYLCGLAMERHQGKPSQKSTLAIGIVLNLLVLGWFKYVNFFVDNINIVAGTGWTLERILLPLAISFYTIQQIAYLVDVSRGEVRSGGLARYATFVIFFPQLIAGPIVHYKEMMPQFFGRRLGRFGSSSITIGLTIFSIGLFKKAVIADSAALYATPIFTAAHAGEDIGLLAAWTAAITYTIQLYFDFSGYSDMAVGLARLFGVRLPPNFHSPLRATSIIEYWRRWHITLQHFIVSYMYQPLALRLTRWSAERRLGKWSDFICTVALPTFGIFVVVGFWHGAAWTFVVFGAMHGAYLGINEFWRRRWRKQRRKTGGPGPWATGGYRLVTLIAVALANVVFRAPDLASAVRIWTGMFRFDLIEEIGQLLPTNAAELVTKPFAFTLICVFVIACLPNTQQLMSRYGPVYDWAKWKSAAPPMISLSWRPTLPWALAMTLITFFAIAFVSRGQSEFIYFNF